jgi:hypothetical protein
MPDPGTPPDKAPGAWSSAIHVGALWALAVAGPVYDVLRRNAEFFVAYRTGRGDILQFVAVVSIAGPLALWLAVRVASLTSPGVGRVALKITVGALVAVLAAQALQPLSPPTFLHVGMAVGFGVIAAALYASPTVRSFTTWLLPAIVAFPLTFLLDPNIASLVWPPHEDERIAIPPGPKTPIVFVVFDQFPLATLLGSDGSIDARTYPGFGELARQSTWFRNATTVGELTTWALPPLVSGVYASADRLPSAAGYPRNLFTMLGRAYAMEVFEPITTLCPDAICRPSAGGRRAELVPMLVDAGVVLLHRVAPRALAGGLPSVTENWRGFVEANGFQRRWGAAREEDRRAILDAFLQSMARSKPASTLYFLHALLPHEPYEYLPSGKAMGYRRLPGIAFGRWPPDEWPVVQAYSRHLLQAAFVDRFVQRLLDRLRAEGLFDEALIVVTSDHGVSFVPGRGVKGLSPATAAGIAPIPLFIKRPFQRAGEVNDRNVQGIDVLPAVAGALGVTLPFEVEGRSPFGAAPAPAEKAIVHAGGRSRMVLGPGPLPTSDVVATRIKWFGEGPGPYWSTRLDPAPALRGRAVSSLPVEDDPNLRISFDTVDDVARVDPAGDSVPAVLSGRVRGEIGRASSVVLAIAINGRIETTTRTYVDLFGTPDGSWVALVNPAVFKPGHNDIRIYLVQGDRLVEAYRNDPPV